MPEEPDYPKEPVRPPEEEWTDEASFLDSDVGIEESDTGSSLDEPLSEAWDDTSLDWEAEPIEADATAPAPTTTREALAWLRPFLQRSLTYWRRILAGLRKRIPAAMNLSDGILSSILIGILAVLLVIFNTVRQSSSAADISPPPSTAPVDRPVPVEPGAAPIASDAAPVVDAPQTVEEGPTARDVANRDRIAQIQTQLTDGLLPGTQGLVESVEADFTHDQLIVTLNDDWYRLSTYEQTELATAFLATLKDLAFEDLQLRSVDDQLIARSPVIGSTPIILLRQKPPEVPPPERPRYRIIID